MTERAWNAVEQRAMVAGRAAFGDRWRPGRRVVAPGRIELLGNHLDYNGGPVLAAAIDRHVVLLITEAATASEIAIVAADLPTGAATAILDPGTLADWRNPAPPPRTFDYARGVIAATLARPNRSVRAVRQIIIAGDVPIGFGLSSSAALCVSLTLGVADPTPAASDLVLIAQEAEHRAGTPCGTMDQSASVAGGVIAFEGATNGVRQLAPDLGDLVFAVADSGVERSLGASSYPIRVEESTRALALAQQRLSREVPHLAALSAADLTTLTEHADPLPDPLFQRVRHIVTETARVKEGISALASADWPRFGELMTASGRSSATDYTISHPRVEALVGEALAVSGILGARMMGGGEGGSVVILVRRDRVDALDATLRDGYFRRYGMADRADLIHPCAFAAGAHAESI
ncbi:MAG: hypothetical protein M3411_04160 [Chloroflexota bacterium]|nr:hypothetical protein [Chloroflexota bacterium]